MEIFCSSESQAMALCAGCILAGEKPEAYMQNSGLMNCIDIVLSLYKPYKIPLPKLLLSLRETPEHHWLVGQRTWEVLDWMEYEDVEVIGED